MKSFVAAAILTLCGAQAFAQDIGEPKFAYINPAGELVVITSGNCYVPEVNLKGKTTIAYSASGDEHLVGCTVSASGKVFAVFRDDSGKPVVFDFTGAPFKKVGGV